MALATSSRATLAFVAIVTPLAPQPLILNAGARLGGARQSSVRERQDSEARAASTKPGDRRPRRRQARPPPRASRRSARPLARPGPSPGSAIRGAAYASHPAYGAPAAGEVRCPAPVKLL